MFIRSVLLLVLALVGVLQVRAQLNVSNAMTPQQLVQDVLLGGGVTAFNVTYNGQANPPANQPGRGSFTSGTTNLGISSGVILSSGRVTDAANPGAFFASNNNNTGADPDLALLAGLTNNNIFDRSILEFDFIPTGDTLRFRYVFASEEYPEYVCSDFNDAFGFFLSGPGITGPFTNNARNIALIPGTNVPVTINSVNPGTPGGFYDPATCAQTDPNWQANSVYYTDNQFGTTVAYDGKTVVLTAFALVQCGQTYHIKLAIADGFDGSFDSAVFLEAGSFTSTGQVQPALTNGFGVNGDLMLEGCGPYQLVFTRVGDLTEDVTVNLSVSGTAVAGVDYAPSLPGSLFFPAGQETIVVELDVPLILGGPRTLVVDIQQIIACAGVSVGTQFTYLINNAPQLQVSTTDVAIQCGQTITLAPVVNGGVGNYTFLWSTGATTPSITVSPLETTTYSVTVGDQCGVFPVTNEITVTLPVLPLLELQVSPPTEVPCLGNGPIGVESITGGNGVYSYAWTQAGTPVGNTATITVPASEPLWYLVTVTDGCGSSIQDSVLVSTAPLPEIVITVSPDVTVICPGDLVTISVVDITGGNGVYTLRWTDEDGNTISNSYSVEVAVPEDQVFTITVNDQCGYEGIAQVSTLLPVYDSFLLQLTDDLVLCAGDSAMLQAVVTGGSGYFTVDWWEQFHTDPVLMVSPAEDTRYVVEVTDQCGEQRMDSVTVKVEYVFTDIVVTNRGQDDWYLQAATTPYAATWLWDMGDGARYRSDEVVHSYLNLEDHWVTLEITTPNGCPGVDSVLLRSPAHLYFPNAFTPDGDGINDLFGPVGHAIEDFEMTIFDRWGAEVFTTRDMTVHWDGRVRGSALPVNGVYVYKYRAKGHLFPSVEGFGHVTLIAGSRDQ